MRSLLLALLVTQAYAQTPPVAVNLSIKTATYAITKQVKDPVTGALKTVTLSRHASLTLAREKLHTMAPGEYKITQPALYATVLTCVVPPPGLCLDGTDPRIMAVIVPPFPQPNAEMIASWRALVAANTAEWVKDPDNLAKMNWPDRITWP